jgi:hypothetical protein
MPETATKSGTITLTINAQDREYLLPLLENWLKETLVEEHRTDSPDYRTVIEKKETALRHLVDQLRRA